MIFDGKVVGSIEYSPLEASGYPIKGEGIVVMNCIWILRKAKGHHLGTCLLKDMIEKEKEEVGFVTIGLVDHWSGWLKKKHMEILGFRSIDSVIVTDKTKHIGEQFQIHLMWLPVKNDVKMPTWDKAKMLEGTYFCLAHPLYHSERLKIKEILQELL